MVKEAGNIVPSGTSDKIGTIRCHAQIEKWSKFFFLPPISVSTTYTCLGSDKGGCSQQERVALLKFKDTAADGFGMLSSWVGNDCCRWRGVRCDNSHVVGLSLQGNNDHADIPVFPSDLPPKTYYYISKYDDDDFNSSIAELRHLKYLNYLDLSGNNFQGNIPEFIGSLKQLTHLNLSNSGFDGNLPHHIGNLSSLKVLDLSDSLQRRLMADDMAWVSGLSSLQHLALNKVDLSAARNRGMVLYKIPTLIELELGDCGVTIADLGSHYDVSITLPNLKHLDLSQTFMTNSANLPKKINIPVPESLESLGKLTKLRVLRLASNRLAGPIPEALGRLSFLQVLDLSSNQLHGPIPSFFGKLITILKLSNNQLNSSIPESLGKLTALTDLVLESNHLTGPITASIGNLSSLKVFSVSSNLVTGNIPVSIGNLTKLTSLDVSNNSLNGVVSEAHLLNLSMLTYFDISYNSMLTFNVSREWVPPFQLRTIHLSSCKIIDHEFPQWLQTQLKLDELVMSNVNISGPLPRWFLKMSIIRNLDLSHNKLTGTLRYLPPGVYLDRYGSLLLQDNLFSGHIPTSICTRQDLLVIDLSINRLTGKLPNCLGNLSLTALIISSNELSGIVPKSIGTPNALWVKLNDNYFTGELPESIWNNRYLHVLDVGDNEFSGVLPELTGVESLNVLRLHRNNFTGSIPASWCNARYLHIFDVAHNRLTGPIPRCLGELSSMLDGNILGSDYRISGSDASVIQVMKGIDLEYTKTLKFVTNMDLSSNKLTGEIPQQLTSLIMLIGLNLSRNHLSGGIPNKIGNMKALNSLDLSENQLTGSIPPSMADLNFLSYLNLSHNNMSGRIPTGNQLQTLNDQPLIYAGNRDLCGAPLPKNCSIHEDPTTTTSKNKHEADIELDIWFYLGIISGLATGFWGIIGVLLFKKQWREKFFMFSEVTMENIYISILVSISKLRKGREVV